MENPIPQPSGKEAFRTILKEVTKEAILEVHPLEERPKSSLWAKWGSIAILGVSLLGAAFGVLVWLDKELVQVPQQVLLNTADIIALKADMQKNSNQLDHIAYTVTESDKTLKKMEDWVIYHKYPEASQSHHNSPDFASDSPLKLIP